MSKETESSGDENRVGVDFDRLAATNRGDHEHAENVFRPLTPDKRRSLLSELRQACQSKNTRHLPPELVAHLPEAPSGGSRLLDLGCGTGAGQSVATATGYEWVGVDRGLDSSAEVLADGHALPFASNSFDAVLSTKVLEFASDPFQFVAEVRRVLKPGGRFLGSVAFLEPFHGTYFHPTHRGVYHLLDSGGLLVRRVAPGWEGILAQARMLLFQGMPKTLAIGLALPLVLAHRLWYRLGYLLTSRESLNDFNRRIRTTGEFYFVADVPKRD